MILPFSTQINGKPTNFVSKIWQGIESKFYASDLKGSCQFTFPKEYIECGQKGLLTWEKPKPKLHTIREDKNGRWKEGNKIDFFINCRQPTMFRFAPVLPVVSTQKILITYTKTNKAMVFIDDKCLYMQDFSLEGNYKMLHLAQNDGFDTIEDFFTYFDKDFTGKIIHWTNLRY